MIKYNFRQSVRMKCHLMDQSSLCVDVIALSVVPAFRTRSSAIPWLTSTAPWPALFPHTNEHLEKHYLMHVNKHLAEFRSITRLDCCSG